jgi:hypothetical protein
MGSPGSSKKNKKFGSSRGGQVKVIIVVLFGTPLYFAMIIRCWNVRGLNDPIKHSELRRLIHQERMAFFGLVETRVRDMNKDNVS